MSKYDKIKMAQMSYPNRRPFLSRHPLSNQPELDIWWVRVSPRMPSKRFGRKGTRRDWKRNHPPIYIRLDVDLSRYKHRLSIGVGVSQKILSSKHL